MLYCNLIMYICPKSHRVYLWKNYFARCITPLFLYILSISDYFTAVAVYRSPGSRSNDKMTPRKRACPRWRLSDVWVQEDGDDESEAPGQATTDRSELFSWMPPRYSDLKTKSIESGRSNFRDLFETAFVNFVTLWNWFW